MARSNEEILGSALLDSLVNGSLMGVDAATDTRPSVLDHLRLKRNQGLQLIGGNNGLAALKSNGKTPTDNELLNPKFEHSQFSRARQLGAAGLGLAGGAGGALAGALLAKALNKKLRLDGDDYVIDERGRVRKKKKSLLKRLGAYGLLGTGIIGGGLLGSNLGVTAAGFLNGLPNTSAGNSVTRGAAIVASPAKKREAIAEAMANGMSRRDAIQQYNDNIRLLTPIARW